MSEERDTPETGPLSIDEYLDARETAETATPDRAEGEDQEVMEAEASEPEADEPEAEDEGPQVLTTDEYGDVLVQVGDERISLADLTKGNLRQTDYSRKTQELAQQRKQLEQELAQREEALTARERQLNEQFAFLEEKEPDWQQEAQEDPLGWQLKKLEWDRKQEQKRASHQRTVQEREQRMRAWAQKTAEIATQKFPEWSDLAKYDAGAEARRQAALSAGFTEAEYNATIDYRLAILLEKAARYDAGQQKVDATTKKLAKVPKVMKPSGAVSKAEREQAERVAKSKRLSGPMGIDQYLDAKGIS